MRMIKIAIAAPVIAAVSALFTSVGPTPYCNDSRAVCDHMAQHERESEVQIYDDEFLAMLSYDVPEYEITTGLVLYEGPTKSQEQLEWMNIAYQLGGKDFLLTLNAENQLRSKSYQNQCHGPNCEGPSSGYPRERSYGFCQLNIDVGGYGYFVHSKYFDDPELQLIKCRNEYKLAEERGGLSTKFYGYRVRHIHAWRFTFTE